MTSRRDRLFAAAGLASVVVELVGTFIAMGKDRTHSLTWTSSQAAVAHAFAKPSTTIVWVGAYLELLSMGLFLAFAVWACYRIGEGVLAGIARGLVAANLAVSMVSLGILDASAYLAGHGLDLSTARALVTVNGAIYVTTWFLSAFFLLAFAPLALAAGRRIVGWSAVGVAAFTLLATAVNPSTPGQFSQLFWLVWIAGTSIALFRGERTRVGAPALA